MDVKYCWPTTLVYLERSMTSINLQLIVLIRVEGVLSSRFLWCGADMWML